MADERWLTAEEIADRLQVHIETVRRWLRAGQLKSTFLGRKAGYRIRESDFEAFMETGPKETAARTSQTAAATLPATGQRRPEGKVSIARTWTR